MCATTTTQSKSWRAAYNFSCKTRWVVVRFPLSAGPRCLPAGETELKPESEGVHGWRVNNIHTYVITSHLARIAPSAALPFSTGVGTPYFVKDVRNTKLLRSVSTKALHSSHTISHWHPNQNLVLTICSVLLQYQPAHTTSSRQTKRHYCRRKDAPQAFLASGHCILCSWMLDERISDTPAVRTE